MAEDTLVRGKRLLVVEDEFFIADGLARDFAAMGADIVGPVPTLEQAMDLLDREPCIDGAVLDIQLRNAASYDIADELLRRGVPVVFVTGYDAAVIPTRYVDVIRCVKPVSSEKVAQALTRTFDRMRESGS